jgi:hypothetical protein
MGKKKRGGGKNGSKKASEGGERDQDGVCVWGGRL